jgi:hypothetical protein
MIGINSVIQAIKAKVHLLGISIPKKLIIKSQKYTVIPIKKHNKICHFNQLPNLE